MKQITNYINESSKSIEDEMKEWEERFNQPFGQTLKELQCAIMDEGLYRTEKNEYGFNIFTPFDDYITVYALDGNKKFTYNKIKAICDDWEFSEHKKINDILKKLESLI